MITTVDKQETQNWDFLREELESSKILRLTGFFNLEDLKYIAKMSKSETSSLFRQHQRDPFVVDPNKVKAKQKVPHLFEKMNFVRETTSKQILDVYRQDSNSYLAGHPIALLEDPIYEKHSKMFFDMWSIYEKLVPSAPGSQEYRMHLLKYHNNSHFGIHKHNYHPQKYGLILLVSQRGKDYDGGGTKFYYTDKSQNLDFIDTSHIENCGDLFIFKYDLVHSVNKTICSEDQVGRLTAIMPWHGN